MAAELCGGTIPLSRDGLAKAAALLTLEAAGVLLRVIDAEVRTGLGIPDGDSTHVLLGLQRKKWQRIRDELKPFVENDGGYLRYSYAQTSEKPAAPARRPAIDVQPPTAGSKPPMVIERPIPSMAQWDAAKEQVSSTANVIDLNSKSRRKQPQLPGLSKSEGAADGSLDRLPSPRKMCFDIGIAVLTKVNKMTEDNARQMIGKWISVYDVERVLTVLGSVIDSRFEVADPKTLIIAKLKDCPTRAETRAARVKAGGKKGAPAATKEAVRAIASPTSMGMSDGLARRLMEKAKAVNSNISSAASDEPGPGAQGKTDEQIFGAMAL